MSTRVLAWASMCLMDNRLAFPDECPLTTEGTRRLHALSVRLALHLRHGAGDPGTGNKVAINRFGWSPIKHVAERLNLTQEQTVALARNHNFHQSGENVSISQCTSQLFPTVTILLP